MYRVYIHCMYKMYLNSIFLVNLIFFFFLEKKAFSLNKMKTKIPHCQNGAQLQLGKVLKQRKS